MQLHIPDPDPTAQPSPTTLRVTGWVLAACGVSLIWMMTGLLVGFTYILLYQDQPGVTVSFTGGPLIALFVYALLSSILVFGFATARGGIYQVRHGQRPPNLLGWVRFIVAAMSFAGVAVQILDLILD